MKKFKIYRLVYRFEVDSRVYVLEYSTRSIKKYNSKLDHVEFSDNCELLTMGSFYSSEKLEFSTRVISSLNFL